MNLIITLIILNIYLSISTTKKTVSKPLTQCYSSFRSHNYVDQNFKEKCSTNCIAYKVTYLNNVSQEFGECNKKNIYVDFIFNIKYNLTVTYAFCNTNLCNSQQFIDKNLNYNCEFGKKVSKNMKLKFPVIKNNLNEQKSVNQCYFCEDCTSLTAFKSAIIVNCSERYNSTRKFACWVKKF